MQQNQWEKTGLVLEKKCMSILHGSISVSSYVSSVSSISRNENAQNFLQDQTNFTIPPRTYVGIFKKKQDIKCMIRDYRLCLSLNVHMCFSVLRYDIKSDVTYLPFSLFSNLNNGKISTK